MERVEAHNFIKSLDSSFEGFFFKREINLKNFNYYFQVLSQQGKVEEFDNALVKMEEMKIVPTLETYTHILTGHAKNKNIQKSEEIFKMITQEKGFLPNKYVYNALLMAYAKNGKIHECEALMKEMRDAGIQTDIICHTTLLQVYKKNKMYNKCWDVYYSAQGNGLVDEFIISQMIRVCAATHDAEKALRLYEFMETKGFIKNAMNYNSIILALSSKLKYAESALEMYQKMKVMEIKPDLYTYVGVLRATAHLGDVNTANDVIKEIKLLGYKVNEHICNGLLRTYAGACRIFYAKTEHIDSYIKDAWEIFHYMEKENIKINVQVLNALMEVHTASHKIEMVDGLVIPLYEKHNISMNEYSYEHIFRMLLDLRNYQAISDLFLQFKAKGLPHTQRILNIYLESSIRNNNSDGIVEALETVRKIDRKAKPALLRILSNTFDLPDRIWVELKEHPMVYNLVNKPRHKNFSPPQFRERTFVQAKSVTRIKSSRTKLR